MGNAESRLQGSTLGLHVLTVKGPALNAGFEVYFDYITHFDGKRVDENFTANIREGVPVNLIVYSSKTLSLRNISVIPNKSSLGIECKLCDFDQAHERVWHVLDVMNNSPSAEAGFKSRTDYILGCKNEIMKNKDDFGKLLQKYDGKPIDLIIYNSKNDEIRSIYVIPDSRWGGEGSLGCDIGYGIMHRIALDLVPDHEKTVKINHSHDHLDHDHHDHCNHNHHESDKNQHCKHDHDHGHNHTNHQGLERINAEDEKAQKHNHIHNNPENRHLLEHDHSEQHINNHTHENFVHEHHSQSHGKHIDFQISRDSNLIQHVGEIELDSTQSKENKKTDIADLSLLSVANSQLGSSPHNIQLINPSNLSDSVLSADDIHTASPAPDKVLPIAITEVIVPAADQ